MSYILEALRRSQAERELGRVPTLEGAALVAEDPAAAPRRWPWALVSVALAGAAVLIALYAAWRAPTGMRAVTADTVVARQASPGANPPRLATTAEVPPSAPAGAPGAVPAAAPLVEAPPPKAPARVSPPVPPPPAPAPDGVVATEPAAQDDAAAQLELELKRQLASDPAAAQDPESMVPQAAPEDPGPTPIPPDLIADIEAFKHQVKGSQGQDKGKTKAKAKDTPVVTAAPPPPAPAGDPTQLRLTRDQQAALPKFLMSVHVYDAQAPRRFVLINGVKYGEGAKTREGLTVEEIRVDGAVLAHEGHPFFVHR